MIHVYHLKVLMMRDAVVFDVEQDTR